MNNIKKAWLSLGVALAPAIMFAEGANETPIYQDTANQVKTALNAALEFLGPVIGAIIVSAVGVWLVPKVVRFILKCFNMGTGR